MAEDEYNIGDRRFRPVPPPRHRRSVAPNDRIYEEVNQSPRSVHYSQYSQYAEPSVPESDTPSEYEETSYNYPDQSARVNESNEDYVNEEYIDLNQARRDVEYSYSYGHNYRRAICNEIITKIQRFKANPEEFFHMFESTRDEIRTDEETFIIVHLLKSSNLPVLDGDLRLIAMLACCSSPHVVKRALDALLNEIFLSISNLSRIRCRNTLPAEEILRESFLRSLEEDHLKAKCHRMTTYAWLTTLILLKCSQEDCQSIQPKVKEFDRTLDALLKDKINSERNLFRYGIYLSRESILRIVQVGKKKDSRESLNQKLKKCKNILNSNLETNEVLELGKTLSEGGSWMDLHVCLVFLQDLTKLHQFHDDRKPVILMQMLIADYRKRCSGTKVKQLFKIANNQWLFEMLVYRVMLRLIRTSTNSAITEQVIIGEQGCGGILRSWIQNKFKTTENDQVILIHLENLCKRAVFYVATPIYFQQFITESIQGDEKLFIEKLSVLRLSSTYKDKILEILPESQVCLNRGLVSTYGALMSGKKCMLKLYQHSKVDVLTNVPVSSVPLRDEIEILKILSAVVEPCSNVVQLFGSSIEVPMHMIIERTPNGDLLNYLQRYKYSPESKELCQISLDICDAMQYLGEHDIIHRDLRAKNCFVFNQHGRMLTKLGDFHLAVLSYSDQRSPTSPNSRNNSVTSGISESSLKQYAVRWMAVESLRFGIFSPASDVWSFGVLLFEIFTFGSKPYVNMPSGISLDRDEKVQEFILADNRLELHPRIPESFKVLIELTMVDADHRPSFSEIRKNILGIELKDETYADPAYFTMLHQNDREPRFQPTNLSTGCNVSGCFGECLSSSDIATPLKVDGSNSHYTKEFIALQRSPDILKMIDLTHSSLAVVSNKIVHAEMMELITEVGDLGSLEEFINLCDCSMENAITYISQIGDAISFLHSRRFIHRNLRASSVFIYSSGNAKLACFSRVRQLKPDSDERTSTMTLQLQMPEDSMRWSSPEVISHGEYNKASDVWAFAVLIWELFTLIDNVDKNLDEGDDEISHLPYHQIASKEEILLYLNKTKRLGKPECCPDWLHEIMLRCWEYNPQDRPRCQVIFECVMKEESSRTGDMDENDET